MRIVLAILLILSSVTACGDDVDQRAVDCTNHGGFTKDLDMTGVGVGVGGNGQVSTTVTEETIRYCIHDGKITDMWQV